MEMNTQENSNQKSFNNKQKMLNSDKAQRTFTIVLLLAIPIINWLIFWFYVNIQTIILAFQDMQSGAWTFNNFVDVWDKIVSPVGNEIGISLINTLKYFATTIIIIIPLCLIVSFFFYKKIFGYKFFRIVFYLPSIISGMVLVTAYREFIDPLGPLGVILEMIGRPLEWPLLTNKETATPTIIVYFILTNLTTNVLIFGGGMSRIPTEVIEAAKLDGCGPARELVQIVFPLIWPTFATQLIFTLTGLFNAGGPILLFGTNGNYDTSTIPYWIFSQVYGGEGGVANKGCNIVSAAGLCFTLIGLPLIMIVRKLTEKVEAVEY